MQVKGDVPPAIEDKIRDIALDEALKRPGAPLKKNDDQLVPTKIIRALFFSSAI